MDSLLPSSNSTSAISSRFLRGVNSSGVYSCSWCAGFLEEASGSGLTFCPPCSSSSPRASSPSWSSPSVSSSSSSPSSSELQCEGQWYHGIRRSMSLTQLLRGRVDHAVTANGLLNPHSSLTPWCCPVSRVRALAIRRVNKKKLYE